MENDEENVAKGEEIEESDYESAVEHKNGEMNVSLDYNLSSWTDPDTGSKFVSIVILLPTGVEKRDLETFVSSNGTHLIYKYTRPAPFNNVKRTSVRFPKIVRRLENFCVQQCKNRGSSQFEMRLGWPTRIFPKCPPAEFLFYLRK